MVKLRFSSIFLHESTSKESRVKLTLLGFMLNIFPDMKRIDSLVSFARPPPGVGNIHADLNAYPPYQFQVFESVVPSERTQITVKIGEGSVRLFAPKSTGAFVLYLGDLDLSTEMIGDSPEVLLRITGRDLAALFADNYLEVAQEASIQSQRDVQGSLRWKARGLLFSKYFCLYGIKAIGICTH
jgi:autophagy-related protein 2